MYAFVYKKMGINRLAIICNVFNVKVRSIVAIGSNCSPVAVFLTSALHDPLCTSQRARNAAAQSLYHSHHNKFVIRKIFD
jgi:hypothetical protein